MKDGLKKFVNCQKIVLALIDPRVGTPLLVLKLPGLNFLFFSTAAHFPRRLLSKNCFGLERSESWHPIASAQITRIEFPVFFTAVHFPPGLLFQNWQASRPELHCPHSEGRRVHVHLLQCRGHPGSHRLLPGGDEEEVAVRGGSPGQPGPRYEPRGQLVRQISSI